MKLFARILPLITAFTLNMNLSAQVYGDAEHYLIDSVRTEALAEEDKQLLDSCLGKYHAAQSDTSRIYILDELVGGMWSNNHGNPLWVRYSRFYEGQVVAYLEQSDLPSDELKEMQRRHCELLIRQSDWCRATGQLNQGIAELDSVAAKMKRYGVEDYELSHNMMTGQSVNYYFLGKYDEVIALSRKMQAASEKEGDLPGQAEALVMLGSAAMKTGQLDTGEVYLLKCIDIFEEQIKLIDTTNKDKHLDVYMGVLSACSNLASLYRRKSMNDQNVLYCEKALGYALKANEKGALATMYNNLGSAYQTQGNYPKAMETLTKALKLQEETGNISSIVNTLINIGWNHVEIGEIEEALNYAKRALAFALPTEEYDQHSIALVNVGTFFQKLNQLDSALHYQRRAMEVCYERNMKRHLPENLYNLAIVQMELGELDSGIFYCDKVIAVSNELGSPLKIKNAYILKGQLYEMKNENRKSIHFLSKAHALAEKAGDPKEIGVASELLAKVYKKEGMWKDAYEMQHMAMKMLDSIYGDKQSRAILKSKYEYEYAKQAAIDSVRHVETEKLSEAKLMASEAQLSKKRTQQYYLIGGLLLVVVFGGIFFKMNKRRQEADLALAQKDSVIEKQRSIQHRLQAMSAQMNPHFIFNLLNSLQYFFIKNESSKVEHFFDKFTSLMRKTLNNSESTFITVKEEVDTLNEYVELEKIRLNQSFAYSIQIDEKIKEETVQIPTLILQPFVENAIWHGISPLEQGTGKIEVQIQERDNNLFCVVDDNGVGRAAAEENKAAGHKSHAMRIAQTRLDLINSLEDQRVDVEVIDKKDAAGKSTGTRIELSIPLN